MSRWSPRGSTTGALAPIHAVFDVTMHSSGARAATPGVSLETTLNDDAPDPARQELEVENYK